MYTNSTDAGAPPHDASAFVWQIRGCRHGKIGTQAAGILTPTRPRSEWELSDRYLIYIVLELVGSLLDPCKSVCSCFRIALPNSVDTLPEQLIRTGLECTSAFCTSEIQTHHRHWSLTCGRVDQQKHS